MTKRRGTVMLIILLAIAVPILTALGIWQLQRKAEVADEIATQAERIGLPPLSVTDLSDQTPDQVEHRRLVATGTYDVANEVLLRSRQHKGQNGWHVLTPLVFGDGTALLVNRGWVPFELDVPPISDAEPPSAEVAVQGVLNMSRPEQRFGAKDPAAGVLERFSNLDLDRIGEQLPYTLLPVWLQLDSQVPTQLGELPIAAPQAVIEPGPHLSYAIQWFSFAIIAIVATTAFLRRKEPQ